MNECYIDFLSDWSEKFAKVKSILAYLHTYPGLLSKLKFDNLIKPEELDRYQEDWVRLVSQFAGMEKEFFKPCWVPVNSDSLDYFIDLSDPDLPLFEMEYFFFEPYHYFKTFLFYRITDLLRCTEEGLDIEKFNEQRLASIFGQADIYFEMRKRLGFKDEYIENENPEIDEL
jgi:hypothetical protein